MKKICFINYNLSIVGGVERVTVELANALADMYEVHIISLCGNPEPAFKLDSRIKYFPTNYKENRLRVMRKELKPILVKYLKENNIDVAFSQGNYTGFLVSALRFSVPAKLVYCDHGSLMSQWHQKDIMLLMFIASFLQHKTVSLTEQNRQAYHKKFLIPNRKLVHITNWISDNVPTSPQYDASSKKIMAVGRFCRQKSFHLLIEAFAPVAKKHPDWHLDIYGDGETMEDIKVLINQHGIEDSVTLMGMCSDVKQRYGQYAMYALSSIFEGMPLVLLEAKANRLPIVSFDIMTGPKEIVRDGVDGILVKPFDLEMFGDAMCRLIENDELRQSMSERSQENVDKFSKPTILKQWCDLIDSL